MHQEKFCEIYEEELSSDTIKRVDRLSILMLLVSVKYDFFVHE